MAVNADALANEQALVAAARAGCVESFERLVDHYHPRILAYLVRHTGDRELAADMAQQTFLDALRFVDRMAASASVSAWLYGVARNKLREAWRRRRLHSLLSLDWLLGNGERDFQSSGLEDHNQTSDYHERDLIQQVLNELMPTLREALLLYSLGGFPSKEVAQILNISDTTARQRISRAKEEFRVRYTSLNGGNDHERMQSAEREFGSLR